MPPKTYDITQENVKGFELPEYNNGLAAEQNGTFTQEWIFDKSEYNSVISGFIKEGGGDELAENGISAPSSLEELRGLVNNLNNDIIDEIELDEIIDIDAIDAIDDIELEFFYELDDTEELSMNEFSELLKKSGIQLEEENVKKLFISLDKNSNGQLDYAEVMRLVDYFSRKKIYTKKTELSKESITEKISVNIDTRFRPEYYKTTSSEFDYEMPDVQKNVINMKIGSVEMPMTSNNTISSKLNNNTFLIISDANTRIEEYDISGSWRFHMQIGDISADYLHGTIQENTKITVDDTSGGRISGFTDGNGQGYYSNLEYSPAIIPIKNVTFEKMDPPDPSISYTDVSDISLEPLKALKTGRYTSLSDVTEISAKGSHTFPNKRNNEDQYMCIFTDEDTPHPEDPTKKHKYDRDEVPGKTEISTKTEVVNYTKTITTTSMYTRFYNFIRLRWCNWGTLSGVWNGYDTNTAQSVMVTEVKYPTLSEQKKINIYSPRGNPRRTDVDFSNLTYLDGTTIDPPYDCKRMNEKTTDTKIEKQIHLKALRYKGVKDGKENTDFNPVKYAWLVTLPDGNYDELINNNNKRLEFELVVNDAIGNAIPGAVDNVENFCAIIEPDDYNYINNANNPLTQNSVFVGEDANTHVIPGYEPELNYSKNSISKRSIFTTPRLRNNNNNNNSGTINNIVSRIIKVNKFTVREGQSGLRTTFGAKEDWGTVNQQSWVSDGHVDSNGIGHMPRQGEPYPEMMALLSKSREPKIVVTPIKFYNPKEITKIKFNIDSYGNEDNDTNIQFKLGWILGFRDGQYEVAQNEDDNENIENIENIEKTIDLAEEKSLLAERTLIDNTATIQERLTPEAAELLTRADSLALGKIEIAADQNVNSDDYILLAAIREYATSLYNHSTDIRNRVADPNDGNNGLLRELEIGFGRDFPTGGPVWRDGEYNVLGPHQGQMNEYYRIISVAHQAIKFIFLEGINSTDGLTISKLYWMIVPDAIPNNNSARPDSTKGDILELAKLVEKMAIYQIALYANYEIIKEACNKIKNRAGNQSTMNIPTNGKFFYQDYHAIVTLPDNELDFAKRAAYVAYIWLYPVSLFNVRTNKAHTAELLIYPARDNQNKLYQGMTSHEWWIVGNSFNNTHTNDYPSYTPETYANSTLAQNARDAEFEERLDDED